MSLTIYGSPRSRTLRVLWMAAELDLEYALVPLEHDDPRLKHADFLALNPAGAIPVIDDDGFTLSESLAINLYLARKHSAGQSRSLYPSEPTGEATAIRWSLWAQGHLEPWVQRDADLTELNLARSQQAHNAVDRSLTTLERALGSRDWLISERFSVADLNVAGVLSPSRTRELDLGRHGAVAAWLERCYARPAAHAVRSRFGLSS